MRQPRRASGLPSFTFLTAALASGLLAACASATPPASVTPGPTKGVTAATPAAEPEPEAPLVDWPGEETGEAPGADPEGPLAMPPAPPLPADPGVEAKIVGAPSNPREALGKPSDFDWDGTKLAARPAPPKPASGPRLRSGSTEVSGRSGASVTGGSLPSDPMSARGSMWGDAVGDSFGAGGLGLGGVGEGGGGKGEGVGLGAVGTMGRGAGVGTGSGFGRGSGPARPRADGQETGVKAGEWDDNANFLEFRRYLAREAGDVPFHRVDLATRRFLVVRDADGKPVPNCDVHVSAAGRSLRLLTTSTGRAVLFPHAEGIVSPSVVATAKCGAAGEATASFQVDSPDGAVDLRLPAKRTVVATPTVDVAFILDTTGSMSEEIDAVKRTVQRVTERLGGKKLVIRFALVEYKDRSDEFLVRVHHMTRDAKGFVTRMSQVRASGGGDMPEDVISGLRAGLTQIEWSRSSSVRLAFLIGDAPPQLGYGSGSYVDAMRAANRAGIVIHTIAASGMNDLGQAVWRQVAQYTGGTNLFVLRGGAGPQSVGAGDAKSSCGGTHDDYSTGNLDALITQKVESAVAALDGDAMRIAGLGQDEKAKPCAQRISQN